MSTSFGAFILGQEAYKYYQPDFAYMQLEAAILSKMTESRLSIMCIRLDKSELVVLYLVGILLIPFFKA